MWGIWSCKTFNGMQPPELQHITRSSHEPTTGTRSYQTLSSNNLIEHSSSFGGLRASMEDSGAEKRLSIRQVFKKMTPALFTAWMITSLLNVMFGYDTTSFAGVQSIPAFACEFGSYDPEQDACALSPSRASFMSSVGFAGKLVGTLVCAKAVMFAQYSNLSLDSSISNRENRSSIYHVGTYFDYMGRYHRRSYEFFCSTVRCRSGNHLLHVGQY